MTHVQTQSHFPGNDVAGAGEGLDRANRSDQSRNILRTLLNCANPFGSAGYRIIAKIHGRCSRMISTSRKCELEPGLASNLKHRSLLDVELQISEDIFWDRRLRDFSGIQSKICNSLAHRNSPGILASQ